MRILIVNGPNLNLLGIRQPDIYGKISFEDYFAELKDYFSEHEFVLFRSNSEGVLIDILQREIPVSDAVIMNPGAYAHTSIAIADTLRTFSVPVVEVHLSNIHAREFYRSQSYTAAAAKGIISGFGLYGYKMAIHYLLDREE